MNTIVLNKTITANSSYISIPVTSRGRAFYTTVWFLHGVATKQNYDNPRLTVASIRLQGGVTC